MSNRLTQIATRTGDDGTTGLGDGTRVPKSHLRVAALGDVDELNSSLGVLLAEPLPTDVRELLVVVQHELFNLGGELSIPGFELLKTAAVLRLDEALAHYNAQLPRLKEFILPAGTRSAALAHVSRTVARRAERAIVALAATEKVNEAPRQYLNRLSDLMFVLARVLNRANLDGLGGDDVYWQSERLARSADRYSSGLPARPTSVRAQAPQGCDQNVIAPPSTSTRTKGRPRAASVARAKSWRSGSSCCSRCSPSAAATASTLSALSTLPLARNGSHSLATNWSSSQRRPTSGAQGSSPAGRSTTTDPAGPKATLNSRRIARTPLLARSLRRGPHGVGRDGVRPQPERAGSRSPGPRPRCGRRPGTESGNRRSWCWPP